MCMLLASPNKTGRKNIEAWEHNYVNTIYFVVVPMSTTRVLGSKHIHYPRRKQYSIINL